MVKMKAGFMASALLAAAGYVAVTMLGTPGGQPGGINQPNRSHRAPSGSKRGQVIRLLVVWPRPYTPSRITTTANDGRRDYTHTQLPALAGRWYVDYSYTPGVDYSITVDQNHQDAGTTQCEILVSDKIADADQVTGVGTLNCWMGA